MTHRLRSIGPLFALLSFVALAPAKAATNEEMATGPGLALPANSAPAIAVPTAVSPPAPAASESVPGVAAVPQAQPASAEGQLAEFQKRVREGSVRELYASAMGDHRTTLLIAEGQVAFYVAQSYQGMAWRVLRFQTLTQAERAYGKFVRESAAWARGDVSNQVVQARQRELEQALRASEERARALNDDVQTMRAQRERIARERQVALAGVEATESENRAARIKLDLLRQQIRQLESELANPGKVRARGKKAGNSQNEQPGTGEPL